VTYPFLSYSPLALAGAASLGLLLACSGLGDPVIEPDPPPAANPSAPVFSAHDDVTAETGDSLAVTVAATDPKGLGLVYTLDGPGALDGSKWTWAPDSAAAGSNTVRIIAAVKGHPEWADTLTFDVIVAGAAAALPPPVAYWSFDEGSGATARDALGRRPIALYGNPARVNGVSGGALRFNGNDQYGESVHAFPDMTEQTLSAWFYLDTLTSTGTATIIQESDGTGGHDNELTINSPESGYARNLMYRTRDPDPKGLHFSKTTFEVRKWYHVAGVARGDTVRLYVNGTLDVTDVAATPYNLAGYHFRIQLARWSDGGFVRERKLKGRIDEVKLFDKALTAAQVRAEWNRHKTAAGY